VQTPTWLALTAWCLICSHSGVSRQVTCDKQLLDHGPVVTGKLLSAQTGWPAVHVLITLSGTGCYTQTNMAGEFQLPSPGPGQFSLLVLVPLQYHPDSFAVRVTEAGVLEPHEFHLTPSACLRNASAVTLLGVVRDRVTGAAVSGASLTWVYGDSVCNALSDTSGHWAMYGVQPGTVVIHVVSLPYERRNCRVVASRVAEHAPLVSIELTPVRDWRPFPPLFIPTKPGKRN